MCCFIPRFIKRDCKQGRSCVKKKSRAGFFAPFFQGEKRHFFVLTWSFLNPKFRKKFFFKKNVKNREKNVDRKK